MRRLALAVIAIMVFTPCTWAQTMEWQGVNNSAATSLSQNDVDDSNLCHDGTATGVRIPTAGEDVFFRYDSPQTI